ncbi:hypothetical protein NDN08_007406 [Rhodosorus marinus]|uniref:C2H2-type domain-containing protein n=1 Tax=Rhodosorus marinus TaxID=101924 RepID=A0AAV8V0B9_9RHOD|nr:hypothetical protein NDN08_007406 [Rhodosorus marinus]
MEVVEGNEKALNDVDVMEVEKGGVKGRKGEVAEDGDDVDDEALDYEFEEIKNGAYMVDLSHSDVPVEDMDKQILVERAYDAYVRTRLNPVRVANRAELVAMEVEDASEHSKDVFYEVIGWDLANQVQKTPDDVGRMVGKRNGLSTRGQKKVSNQLQTQLDELPKTLKKYRGRQKLHVAPAGEPEKENRRVLHLWLELEDDYGKRRVLREELEWDISLSEDINAPDWFAWYMCEELGLGVKNVNRVAEHIRMQLQRLKETQQDAHGRLGVVEGAMKAYKGTFLEQKDAYSVAREMVYASLMNTFDLIASMPFQRGLFTSPFPAQSTAGSLTAAASPQRSPQSSPGYRASPHPFLPSPTNPIVTPRDTFVGLQGISSTPTPTAAGTPVGNHPIGNQTPKADSDILNVPSAMVHGLASDGRTFRERFPPDDKMLAEGAMPLVCSFPGCGRRFKEPGKVQKHETIHYDDADHHVLGRLSIIEQIDEDDFDERDPRRDTFLHDTALPHRCPYVGCVKSFYFNSQLQRHKVYHEKEGHLLRADTDIPEDWGHLQYGLGARGSYSTRRNNPLPSAASERLGLGLRASPKSKFLQKKERREPMVRLPKPSKPPPPVVNAVVHGVDLRSFRLHAYKREELMAFRNGRTKPRHNHAKGGGCIPCKLKSFGLDIPKMRDVVRVFLREMRKMRGEPPEEEEKTIEEIKKKKAWEGSVDAGTTAASEAPSDSLLRSPGAESSPPPDGLSIPGSSPAPSGSPFPDMSPPPDSSPAPESSQAADDLPTPLPSPMDDQELNPVLSQDDNSQKQPEII